MGLSEKIGNGERLEGNRRPGRLFLLLGIVAAAITLVSLGLVLTRDFRDPLWRVHRAFEQIEVPERWQLVHQAEDEGAHGLFGDYPRGERTYIAREKPEASCRASAAVLASWSPRTPKVRSVEQFPDVRYRCAVDVASGGVLASFTVWDAEGWAVHAEVIGLDLGRPIGEGTSVVELAVMD